MPYDVAHSWSSRGIKIPRLRHSGAQLLLPDTVSGGAVTEIVSLSLRQSSGVNTAGDSVWLAILLLWSTLFGTRFAHTYASMIPPEPQTANCTAP